MLAHRKAYGSYPWDAAPDRVQWCGRRYYRASPSPNRVRVPATLYAIFRAPPVVGDRFYARVPHCHDVAETLIYRDDGNGAYAVYELSGGP